MTSGQAGASQSSNRGTNWPTAIASLAVGAGFLALWFWLLPPWLGFQFDTPWCGTLALDCGRAVCAGFRSSGKVHLGFRMDRPRYSGTHCSSAEASGCGILPACAESDVRGLLRGLAQPVGDLWPCEPGSSHRGHRGRGRSSFICAARRGAHPAPHVRRAI